MMSLKNKCRRLTALVLGITVLFQTALIGSVFADGNEGIIKVACVGDSITEGTDYSSEGGDYPAQLQRILGNEYKVGNFGLSGSNVIKAGASYLGCGDYAESAAMIPDIVVIMLGTNDIMANPFDFSKEVFRNEYKKDYKRLIDKYKELNEDVKIILMSSPACRTLNDGLVKSDNALSSYIRPLTEETAAENGCEYIDIYTYTKENFSEYDYRDTVHFNPTGYGKLAQKVADAIAELNKPKMTAAQTSATAISVIPTADISGDIYVAAYDSQNTLIGVDKLANRTLRANESNIIATSNADIKNADSVKVYAWNTSFAPQAGAVESGKRFLTAGNAVVISGTDMRGGIKKHGIIIKDESGNTVFAGQMTTGANGEYLYPGFVPKSNGKYTVYTTGAAAGIVETLEYTAAEQAF